MEEKAVIIIPVRLNSQRLPKKALKTIHNKPLIEWVWLSACKNNEVQDVVIATDSQQIQNIAESFGAKCIITSKECRNGTERVYQAWQKLNYQYDIIINFQGDMPFLPKGSIDYLIKFIRENKEVSIATLCYKITKKEYLDVIQNIANYRTKGTFVVLNKQNKALYFSRFPIPFYRDFSEDKEIACYRHLGVYGYKANGLKQYISLSPTPLEEAEKLEQLRILENNLDIFVKEIPLTTEEHCSVDTKEDIKRAELILSKMG